MALNNDYRFDVQLAQGVAAETWFYEMTAAGDRFEVKHDTIALKSRRVYLEYEDDPGRTGNYRPSGISTTEADAWIYVFGNPPLAFLGVSTKRLKELGRRAYVDGRRVEQPHGSCPTRGVTVPLEWLLPQAEL